MGEMMCIWAGLPEPAWTYLQNLEELNLLEFIKHLVSMLHHKVGR